MRFREAQKELAKLADGEYHTIARQITSPGDGAKPIVKYSVYIHGYDYHNGKTWEEALGGMREELRNPQASKAEPTTEDIF